MISDIEEFIKSFHGQRRRTQWVVDAVPLEKTHWRPWPGELSPAEIICRIAAGHLMYAGAIAFNIWEVDDYESAATNWDDALSYFHFKTEAALDLLRPLPNSILKEKCRRPDDNLPTTTWRFLLAMLEHEIHHRSQLNTYLMLMNARQPNMGGITIETVREIARKARASFNEEADVPHAGE
ncbi:MAG: DinB family protein [Anaerolineae bacterium]|nr:DinB family protein [Anaerolineae bacterium]